jgi:hypothetical protein
MPKNAQKIYGSHLLKTLYIRSDISRRRQRPTAKDAIPTAVNQSEMNVVRVEAIFPHQTAPTVRLSA